MRIPLPAVLPTKFDIASLSQEEKLGLPLSRIGLCIRTVNSLEKLEITTVRDLLSKSEQELLGIKNFSHKGLQEVYQVLARLGFVKKGAN